VAILSIQSHVAYGHVGNRAAVFPLELLGQEVWPINTLQFSNHRGYASCNGEIFTGAHIQLVWSGIKALGIVHECDAVLSGYLGSVEIGAVVLGAVLDVKASNPGAVYCCDPVIGDYGKGIYVDARIPRFLADSVIRWAEIVTPNQFEAEFLADRVIDSVDAAKAACDAIRSVGPRMVLLKSFNPTGTNDTAISMFLATDEDYYVITTPEFHFDLEPHGGGDLCAALFLGRYLENRDPVEALELCASSLFAVFERTKEASSGELMIVRSREDILAPRRRFSARRV
jgi:pyridoxine kinase